MSTKNDMIKRIIALEWEMFDAVNKGLDRADCQEDYPTFSAMRAAQFLAWSDDMVDSYLTDLTFATKEERNLISDKYIHMMKTTVPSSYAKIADTIEMPSDIAVKLAKEITNIMIDKTSELFEKYPNISGAGRPLYSISDNEDVTSVETYQLCELYTYSEETLAAFKEYLTALELENKSLPQMILENTVKIYGYNDLESAETAASALV